MTPFEKYAPLTVEIVFNIILLSLIWMNYFNRKWFWYTLLLFSVRTAVTYWGSIVREEPYFVLFCQLILTRLALTMCVGLLIPMIYKLQNDTLNVTNKNITSSFSSKTS